MFEVSARFIYGGKSTCRVLGKTKVSIDKVLYGEGMPARSVMEKVQAEITYLLLSSSIESKTHITIRIPPLSSTHQNQNHLREMSIRIVFYPSIVEISQKKFTTPHSSASSPTCARYAIPDRWRDCRNRAGRAPTQCTFRCRCRRPRAARRPCRCTVGSSSREL